MQIGVESRVGDAIDLSWKLAATLQGWGGPKLLAAYEAERRPVGVRNVAASRYASLGRRKWRALWRDLDELVRVAEVEQRKSNEMIGAELSYRYAGSFVRFLVDRHGLPAVLEFFRRGGGRDETLAAIRARAESVFGRSFDQLEADWLAFLRG